MLSRLKLGSLRVRFLGALLFLSLLPLIAVGLLIERQTEATLRSHTFDHVSIVALLRSQQIEAWVNEWRSEVMRAAAIATLQNLVATFMEREGDPGGQAAYEELHQILERIRESDELAEMFLLEPTQGRVVVSTDPEQEGKFKDDRPYFRQGRKGPFVQHVYYSLPLARPVMAFSAPVPDRQGRLAAILVSRVNLRFLDRLMAEGSGLGETGSTFLVNRFNYFVSDSLGRGKHGWRPVFSEGAKRGLAGETGSGLYLNHENRRVVGAYRWLPALGLALIAEVDQQEAFAPIWRLRLALLGVLALLSGGAVGVALGLTYGGITRPLTRLVEAVRAIGGGDLTRRVAAKGSGEVSTLASAINLMADDVLRSRRELEAHSQTLESRVQERTAESEARRREAEELALVAGTLTESLDVTTVGERITNSVLPLFGVEGSALWLLQPDRSLVVSARDGPAYDHFEPGYVLPPGTSLAGLAVAEGRPVQVQDVQVSPLGVVIPDEMRRRLMASGIRGVLVVPLRVKGKAIGTLAVHSQTKRAFSEAEVLILQAFADQAALALENARLYQESESRQKRLAALVDVSQRLTRGLDLPVVLNTISEAAATVFEGEAGFRLLEGEDLVRVAATPGAGQVMPRERLRMGESLSGHVAASGEAIITADVSAHPRLIPDQRPMIQPERTGALMCVPLRLESRILGTLNIYREQGYRFDQDALSLAMSLADQAAIAIQNARLYQEITGARDFLQSIAENSADVIATSD
ncbi:MAG: GAF domain-containing protein, partial [Candidatus Methylomirabilia bacterium]